MTPGGDMKRLPLILDLLAIVLAFTAGVISLFALHSSNEATANNARAEITDYAIQMIQLDRQGDERNTRQITLLAEQANAVIQTFEQDRVKLTSSTYRVLAEYTTLVTDNRALAREFGFTAVTVAQKEHNFIEEIRAYRALADVAAKDGNVEEMKGYVTKALALAETDALDSGTTQVLRTSVEFTSVFAVYSALLANINGAGPDACPVALEYFRLYEDRIHRQADFQSLEVSRRAYRLRSHMRADALCGLDPQKDLHLVAFRDIWTNYKKGNN